MFSHTYKDGRAFCSCMDAVTRKMLLCCSGCCKQFTLWFCFFTNSVVQVVHSTLWCFASLPLAFPSHSDRASRHHLWLSLRTETGLQLFTSGFPFAQRQGFVASPQAFPSHSDRASTHLLLLLNLFSLLPFTKRLIREYQQGFI
jgi:hypothetical protein